MFILMTIPGTVTGESTDDSSLIPGCAYEGVPTNYSESQRIIHEHAINILKEALVGWEFTDPVFHDSKYLGTHVMVSSEEGGFVIRMIEVPKGHPYLERNKHVEHVWLIELSDDQLNNDIHEFVGYVVEI